MRIALDIDEVLADFWGEYCKHFDTENNPKELEEHRITKNVYLLRNNRDFWLNIPVVNRINFTPQLYCTKRIIPKCWTKRWLQLNGFPDAPIYQMLYQQGNKADMIKGKCDILIDDSLSNVLKCHKSGLPALLYHTEKTADFPK